MTAINVSRLVRTYGSRRRGPLAYALSGLSLQVEQGETRGLLGPNGAGKTTLCKILSTILMPTSGSVQVLGYDVVKDVAEVKRSIGIVFGGDRGLYGQLDARQNLRFWGAVHGLQGQELRGRVDGLLERLGLAARSRERVDGFSRGMKQRLHLARGLIGDPRVLILDEPTVGMDPVAAHDFRTLVRELRAEGRTVLITTHDMAEAEAICDVVTLVDQGKDLVTGSPASIGRSLSVYERVDVSGDRRHLAPKLQALGGVVAVRHLSDEEVTRVETDSADGTRAVLELCLQEGITDIAVGRPSLEEVYLHFIGPRGMELRP